jgi:hypothetical protein
MIELQTIDRVSLVFLYEEVFFGCLVPYSEGSICAARSDPVAIWGEINAIDGHLVLLVGSGGPASPDVPDFDVGVFGARGNQVGILEIDGEASDSCSVAGEAHFLLVGGDVPEVDGAALGT